MNLYRLKTSGTFVGTQADAKSSGEEWEPFDFPTNPKSDTIAALNKLVPPRVDINPEPPKLQDEASLSERIITENLDGKVEINNMVDFVLKCHTISLGRVAKAVALRYDQLSKRKKK